MVVMDGGALANNQTKFIWLFTDFIAQSVNSSNWTKSTIRSIEDMQQ